MAIILVVDDIADNRRLAEIVLGRSGHTVLQAASGSDALELLRGTHADLVLSDIYMPGMTGFEFARAMKSDPTICTIPVLFTTASPDIAELQAEAGPLSQHQILPKNGDICALTSAVYEALRGHLGTDQLVAAG